MPQKAQEVRPDIDVVAIPWVFSLGKSVCSGGKQCRSGANWLRAKSQAIVDAVRPGSVAPEQHCGDSFTPLPTLGIIHRTGEVTMIRYGLAPVGVITIGYGDHGAPSVGMTMIPGRPLTGPGQVADRRHVEEEDRQIRQPGDQLAVVQRSRAAGGR